MILQFSNFLGRNSAVSASEAADPDYPPANLLDELRDTRALMSNDNDQYIQFDINLVTRPCDYFFLDRGHNLAGAAVHLEGCNNPDFPPGSVTTLFTVASVQNDSAIIQRFDQATFASYRLYLQNLVEPPSLFGVYFGKSQSLGKYPSGPCRPDTIRAEKEVLRFQSGRKRVQVYYTEHRIDYEWPRIKPTDWPWFAALELETDHLTRPFWLQWEGHHAEPVLLISEDDTLDWEYVNGTDRRVKLSAEEYL